MTVYAPLIGMLWRTLESYGFDPTQIIPDKIYRPGTEPGIGDRISLEVYERLLTRAAALVADRAIGLRAAKQLQPSHLGALGHAWIASSSLRTAIMRSQRFHRMLNERLTVQVSEPPGFLQVEYVQPGSAKIRNEQVDALLGSLLHMCRLSFGSDFVPAYVLMQRTEPPDSGAWKRFFGIEVQFGEALDCLALHEQDADKPLTVFSPQLLSVHEDIMSRHLAKLEQDSISNRVRVAIMDQLPSGGLKEDDVAEQLHMTRRTLYNRLRKEGTSFRKLLMELRKDLVQSYLRDESYSITEISFLLGYESTSTFSRAFRAWFGASPTEYLRLRKRC